jgi:hypothetical protein
MNKEKNKMVKMINLVKLIVLAANTDSFISSSTPIPQKTPTLPPTKH